MQHCRFVDLYYSAGTIYDLLCYGSYLGALLVYTGYRGRGQWPGLRGTIGIGVLYVLALDAKEMAVTLPLMILVYEAIFHTVELRRRRVWIVLGTTTTLTAVYIAGKLTGPGSLVENPAYALSISPVRLLKTFHLYMNPLFYQDHRFHDSNTVQILTGMLVFAVLVRSRVLAFAWCWLLLTILPVSFIAHYAAFFEYLPAVGWALYGATVLVMTRRALVRLIRAGPGGVRVSQAVLFLGVAGFLAPLHAKEAPKTLAHFMSVQPPSREITEDLGRLGALPPRARVLYVDDPFPADSYFLLFVTRLFYRDTGLEVERTRVHAVSEAEYGQYDAVFGFRGNRLIKK